MSANEDMRGMYMINDIFIVIKESAKIVALLLITTFGRGIFSGMEDLQFG